MELQILCENIRKLRIENSISQKVFFCLRSQVNIFCYLLEI